MTPRRAAQLRALRPVLDTLYDAYNRPALVDPDPLAPVLHFSRAEDQEIAGLVAASLAFGNVKQILVSIGAVLARIPEPRAALLALGDAEVRRGLRGFRHRYADGEAMAALLIGARRVIEEHGSLGGCFAAGMRPDDADVVPGMAAFSARLRAAGGREKNYLLADAGKGSASKRWCMYLRWMARRDAVDPGPWAAAVSARLLVVPIDTHMHRFCRALGLTKRNGADLRTAREVSAAFRVICPDDPVRYDFAITRLGIRREGAAAAAFLEAARAAQAAVQGR